MLIAQLSLATSERGGDWFYRIHGPGRALAETNGIWTVDAPHIHRARRGLLETADILIINMVPDVDLRPVIAARRARGQRTVFEMNDDVAHLHPSNPYARFYVDPYEVTKLKQLMGACDGVQFSTPELQRIYGRYTRAAAVFMNQMPAQRRQRLASSNINGPVVIGWGGSAGHLPDLAWVAPALTRWMQTRANVELRIMGDPALFDLFRAAPPAKRRHVPIGDIDAYYDFVSGLHIGIAPLQDSGFNRSRSDVKFLEYALHGAAPIVQDLAPYRATVRPDETGLLVGEPEQLIGALDRLVDEPDTRLAIAARAQAYVQRERSGAAAAEQRLNFYRALLPDGHEAARVAHARAVCEQLQAIDGAEVCGRHVSLGFGGYEELVRRALVLGGANRGGEAMQLLEQAAALQTDAYQPLAFGALFAKPAERQHYLQRALAREPRSLSCWIELGDQLNDAGAFDGALRAYAGAAEIEPTFDQAYAKTSLLMNKLGRHQEAHEFGAIAQAIQKPFLTDAPGEP
ncbi:MAG TPA: glycosyltransferase [Polyangia bacterium]|jgi:tetratricopeptide (TPR) repeat protein